MGIFNGAGWEGDHREGTQPLKRAEGDGVMLEAEPASCTQNLKDHFTAFTFPFHWTMEAKSVRGAKGF